MRHHFDKAVDDMGVCNALALRQDMDAQPYAIGRHVQPANRLGVTLETLDFRQEEIERVNIADNHLTGKHSHPRAPNAWRAILPSLAVALEDADLAKHPFGLDDVVRDFADARRRLKAHFARDLGENARGLEPYVF